MLIIDIGKVRERVSAYAMVDGYRIPNGKYRRNPSDTKNDKGFYFSLMKAVRETDVAIAYIIHFDDNNGKENELLHVQLREPPFEENSPELFKIRKIESELRDNLRTGAQAARRNDSKVHISKDSAAGRATIIVKAKDGYVGCAVYDGLETNKKAPKLASILLYVVGCFNCDYDEAFANNTYDVLPDTKGSGIADIEAIDDFIENYYRFEK